MALQKQNLNISFSAGVDKKTDPFQVPAGKFLALSNSVFDTLGQLTKRNGFGFLASLPSSDTFFLTTFKSNLTALSSTSIQAYSADTATWITRGSVNPVSLSTLPLIHSNLNQTQVDAVVAANGLICTVYTENGPVYRYAIADSVTGQNVVAPTPLPVLTGSVAGAPRVFLLGNYFIIIYTNLNGGTYSLKYIAISSATPTSVSAVTLIASAYTPSPNLSWDGVIAENNLYIAYNTIAGGQAIRMTSITAGLQQPVTALTIPGPKATSMSLAADTSVAGSPKIYVSYFDSSTNNAYTLMVDRHLAVILSPTLFSSGAVLKNLASICHPNEVVIYSEVNNIVSALGGITSDYIETTTVSQIGAVSPTTVVARSLGLASKVFSYNSISYMMAVQSSALQPTYFLINEFGQVISRIAYQNGYGYYTNGLPTVTVAGTSARVPYLIRDQINSVNKGTNNPSGTQTGAIYAQTGINLVNFDFNPSPATSEIGNNLLLTGGFLSSYDGYSITEQNFFLYPENVTAVWSASGGSMQAQPNGSTNINAYYYQATYEWSDNQGNLYRSAPSVPVAVTTSGSGTAGSISVSVPTLRLTYKTDNVVKIVIYRWSVAQENYYQITSIITPTLNNTSVDYITFVDTLADSSIIGNNLIYTTGGVLENIQPPGTNVVTLFNNRFWMVDAEDTNLLFFSKQVIEATPVEMTDLQTLYVAPTTGVQGSTGPVTAMAAMNSNLIVFKPNAIYYVNGSGPDVTGSNNQYSDAIFVTSAVGCANPRSIGLIPNGLMFESNKGIWILGVDLHIQYIGAPVESYTVNAFVQSVVCVPGTNQIRFAMSSGITLVYDYYVGQWATFSITAVSSVIYSDLHTYVNRLGQVFKETPGSYIDGSNPVLMSLTTNWMQFAGIQGFERFYEMYFLGRYITPFKLNVNFSFDFENGPSQNVVITPDNSALPWGGEQLWGSGEAWGGTSNAFKSRVFPNRQKCESFQLSINELYDASLGVQAGAGLTLSGMNFVAGVKRGFRTQKASQSFG